MQKRKVQKRSETSEVVSTSKEKGLFPFWTEQLGVRSSTLWFPTKTDLRELDSISLNGLSSMEVEQYESLMNLKAKKGSATKTSFRLSPSFAIPTTASVQIVTKKIRIYPKNESKWIELCDLHRYAYNAMTAINKDYKNHTESTSFYRKQICDNARNWGNYVNHVIQEAVRKANITKVAVIKKRKKGEKCELSFKSRNDTRQGFQIERLPKKGIYPRFLKEGFICTEQIPEYAFGKTARVIFEYDQWFLCCQDVCEVKKQDISRSRIVAVDQGVRTFASTYNQNEVIEFGRDFQKNKILPLLLEMDQLIGARAKLPKEDIQWVNDRRRFFAKKINKIKVRVKNLKTQLHRVTADVLTKNYDVILLPTFEVSNMVAVESKLSSKVSRCMLSLGHYQFKVYLKWIAKKRGKIVIDVDESYTSKTNPFTGELMDIGSARSFRFNGKRYDRDVNGARNIFIKNTMREDSPLYITAFVSNVA